MAEVTKRSVHLTLPDIEDELENNEIAIEDSWLNYIKYIVAIKQALVEIVATLI